MPDHYLAETSRGLLPTAEYIGQFVPIHLVVHAGALLENGHWNIQSFERIIGKPREYPSRMVRLFAVLPELNITKLRIRELMDLLKVYAGEHDLGIELTYYPTKGYAAKERYNVLDTDKGQQRISIDVLGKEAVDGLWEHGHAGKLILQSMHLVCPTWKYKPEGTREDRKLDIDGMAPHLQLESASDDERNYNVLAVHHRVNDKLARTDYLIALPSSAPA